MRTRENTYLLEKSKSLQEWMKRYKHTQSYKNDFETYRVTLRCVCAKAKMLALWYFQTLNILLRERVCFSLLRKLEKFVVGSNLVQQRNCRLHIQYANNTVTTDKTLYWNSSLVERKYLDFTRFSGMFKPSLHRLLRISCRLSKFVTEKSRTCNENLSVVFR